MRKQKARLALVVLIALVVCAAGCALVLAQYHVYDMVPTSQGLQSGMAHGPGEAVLSLASPAFGDGAAIPSRFTCDSASPVSPALEIAHVPDETRSLVLIMEDPDIPDVLKDRLPADNGGVYTHWIMFNIPATTTSIAEGAHAGTLGANDSGAAAYAGPCPPPQYEPSEHRYVFTLYALDTELALPAGATRAQVLAAMKGHVIETATSTGRYKRI